MLFQEKNMLIKNPLFLCLILITFSKVFVFSQEETWDAHTPRTAGENIKYGLIAGTEALSSVAFLTAFNFFFNRTTWSLPTKDSIKWNFTQQWWWEDNDDFGVNQLGHPFQGLFSFGAGRVNGFNFYQSVFFSASAGFVWEAFGESNHASMNDFITTVVGSMPTGEMFYRLYLEAYAADLPEPLIFFINPMADMHRLLTKWKPPDPGRNLEMLQFFTGSSFAKTQYSVSNKDKELYYFRGVSFDAGGSLIYGNPFEQETWIPYRQFEFSFAFGINYGNYINLTLISDGYLFSFSPVYTDKDAMSTGLSMHFDYRSLGEFSMEDSTINQYSSALDWTVKYRHLFFENVSFQAKLHSGLTFFGSSKYYANLPVINDLGHIKKDFNNFGWGPNCKWLFSLKHEKFSGLDLCLYYYLLFTFPETTYLTHGNVNMLFADIGYTYFFTRHICASIIYSIAKEWGSFDRGFITSYKSNDAVKLYIAWNR